MGGFNQGGGGFYWYGKRAGNQFIAEATDLKDIQSNSYDFLLSSNCLEHSANPLKALEEWIRIISPDGYLLLVCPKKDDNFDNRRAITSFEHLVEDYKMVRHEDDLTHLNEVLSLHDLERDPHAGDYLKFKDRCLNNLRNREMHHHVFDMALMTKMFNYFNVRLIQSDTNRSDYFALGKVSK